MQSLGRKIQNLKGSALNGFVFKCFALKGSALNGFVFKCFALKGSALKGSAVKNIDKCATFKSCSLRCFALKGSALKGFALKVLSKWLLHGSTCFGAHDLAVFDSLAKGTPHA